MTSHSDKGVITGASVIGPAHIRQHMPNQDAFKYRNYGYGCVIAIHTLEAKQLSRLFTKHFAHMYAAT